MRKKLVNQKNQEKNEDNNIKFSNKKKIITVSILILIIIVAIPILMFGFVPQKVQMSDVLLYSYNITRDTAYKVELFDNSFIQSDYLEEGQTYIADLVKNISANFKYSLSGSKKSDISCTYSIVATIQGEYQASSDSKTTSVWKKDYIISEEKTISEQKASSVNINEDANIDFKFYNNEVSEFRKKLKLPISATLSVKMLVKTNVVTYDETKTADESFIQLVIPLNKQAFEITENLQKNDSKTVLSDYTQKYNIPFIVIGIVLIVGDIVAFLKLYKKIFDIDERSEYRATLNKILKNYGDVVVEIVKPVKTKITGVIDVKSFNEMIDLEEELRIPILFHEIPGRGEGWFTLIHHETLYRYVLKDEKPEKENIENKDEIESTNEEVNTKRRRNK